MSQSSGALRLFAAVTLNFLFVWFQTGDFVHAQTMAFATWMLGHILLALNFRSEREPPSALGFLSNKVMVLWAILVAATLFIGTNLPIIRSSLHTTNLTLVDWALALIVSFVATFWLELKKI